MSDLYRKLRALRPEMAEAAQAVYDDWQQDTDGYDEELGTGGACDAISRAISDVIASSIDDVDIAEGGQEGSDHSFVIAYDSDSAYAVDIAPSVYESGAGYSWTKRQGVEFQPGDVYINEVDIDMADLE